MTELVLIPCCLRKRSGGDCQSATPSLAVVLDNERWKRLCSARVAIAEMVGLEVASDIDGTGNVSTLPLLPAHLRYDGNLYRSANLGEDDLAGARRVYIISALYGLMAADDPIRYYNLQMKDMLPVGVSVKKWWRDVGLLDVVINLASSIDANRLHDLLSGHYRDALRGLSRRLPNTCAYEPHDYPGLGTGSDFHRGADLKKLLLPMGEIAQK